MMKMIKGKRLQTSADWDNFFQVNGQWERNKGREQTRRFAKAFCRYSKISIGENQSLLDCGCALGDALPLLKDRFPMAELFGCDYSSKSIQRCKNEKEGLATFFISKIDEINKHYDVIYLSNTLEHFLDYDEKARYLSKKCDTLCILVPYNEQVDGKDLSYDQHRHHIVTFRENSFDFLISEGLSQKIHPPQIFSVPGAWSWTIKDRIIQSIKNIFRLILGKEQKTNKKQILFEIYNRKNTCA